MASKNKVYSPRKWRVFPHSRCCAEILREIELADLSAGNVHMKEFHINHINPVHMVTEGSVH